MKPAAEKPDRTQNARVCIACCKVKCCSVVAGGAALVDVAAGLEAAIGSLRGGAGSSSNPMSYGRRAMNINAGKMPVASVYSPSVVQAICHPEMVMSH